MLTQRSCAICGEPFPSKSVRNKYCSERCKLTANNHVTYKKMIEQGRCPSCHHPKEHDGCVVCADCRAGARERHIKRKSEPLPFPCVICGTPFMRNSTNALYCSNECRKATPVGLCPRCKRQPRSEIKGIKLCDACHEKRIEWWNNRSESSREIALQNVRAWRERNPDYYKGPQGANGRSNFKVKMEIFDHYGPACACCGETNLYFLTIDHIDGKGNDHRREIFGSQTAGPRFYRWLKNNGLPSGYRVLCYNCNIASAKCGGICPHKLNQSDA